MLAQLLRQVSAGDFFEVTHEGDVKRIDVAQIIIVKEDQFVSVIDTDGLSHDALRVFMDEQEAILARDRWKEAAINRLMRKLEEAAMEDTSGKFEELLEEFRRGMTPD